MAVFVMLAVVTGCSGAAERVSQRPAPAPVRETVTKDGQTQTVELLPGGGRLLSGSPREAELLRELLNSLTAEQLQKANQGYAETGDVAATPERSTLHFSELTPAQQEKVREFWAEREAWQKQRGTWKAPAVSIKVGSVEETEIYYVGWRLGPRGHNNQTMLRCELQRGQYGTGALATYDGVIELSSALKEHGIDYAKHAGDPFSDWVVVKVSPELSRGQ